MKRVQRWWWPICGQRARKLRKRGVAVFYHTNGRTGYRGMARMNPMLQEEGR